MRKLNKKAGEKILSIWWFASLAFVGAAVVVVLMMYFGAFVDVRGQEAVILREKIMDCVVEGGYLQENILEMNPEKFMEHCKLNPNQFEKSNQFYFNLTIYNSTEQKQQEIEKGDVNFRQNCEIAIGLQAKRYPVCIENKEAIIFFNQETAEKELWSLNLLVGTDNHGYKQPITSRGETE